MSAEDVGKAFVAHYYGQRDTNPAALAGAPHSFISTVYAEPEAAAAIVEKFTKLGPVAHNAAGLHVDIQSGPGGQTLIIFVTGHLKIGTDGNPLQFSQVFQLVSIACMNWFLKRLIMDYRLRLPLVLVIIMCTTRCSD